MKSFLYRKYKSLETKEHELKYLFLEITRKCNLSCIHCGSDCSADSSMKEMTTESWISIIDYMVKLYNPIFVITGGEPLVCDSFYPIISHLEKSGARWGMVTNGMALNPERLNTIINSGIESITLSLDGDEKSHFYIRRHPQSWTKVLNAVKLIGESSIPVKDVVTCVFPGNINELESTAELLIKNGITSWRLFRIFPKGGAADKPELQLSFQESQKLIKWISDNRQRLMFSGLNVSLSCEGYLPMALDRKVRNEPFFCRAGISIASILSDGTVTGCNNNGSEFYQGNLENEDFNNIWENKFKEYRGHSWKNSGKCKDCTEWKNCLGGSIHLRTKGTEGPQFCYMHEVLT